MSYHDYITTPARRVTPSAFPSKPMTAPRLSLAEDAAQCNARLRQSMGLTGTIIGGDPKARKEAAVVEYALRDEELLDLLHCYGKPMTMLQIQDETGFSKKVATQTLARLRDAGKIFATQQDGGNRPSAGKRPNEWQVVK
jgi:hypothetical protein